MASIEFSELVRDIALDVAGCPDFLIEKELRRSAIEFCSLANVWFFELPAISTVAGQTTYPLPTPGDTAVARVISVRLDGRPLRPQDRSAAALRGKQRGRAEYYHYRSNAIVVSPAPSAAAELVVDVSLKPTREAEEIDAEVVEDWAEAIASGAIARLCSQRERDWFDGPKATRERQKFEQYVMLAQGSNAKSSSILKSRYRW